MNAEPSVTTSEVAQHLGVVKDTVYRWRERKGLPTHKIGRLLNSSFPRTSRTVVARRYRERT